jgi:cation transport protein ChaC
MKAGVDNAAVLSDFRSSDGDFWIFGYGSLMWNPGFPYRKNGSAIVSGWHRSFCIQSAGHRGTPEWPGLVVALEPGGECRGLAMCVAAMHKKRALAGLWRREMMLAEGYRPQRVTARLDGGETVEALAFVADPHDEAYAGELPLADMAPRIATARGWRGTNRDYLSRMLEQMEMLGICDNALASLNQAVRAVRS